MKSSFQPSTLMSPKIKTLHTENRPWRFWGPRPGPALSLAFALLLASPLYARQETVQHVIVRKPPEGRGLMAPNNGGIWSWGDEILVMYVNGPHKNGIGCGSHSTQEGAPGATYDTSRSLDGGVTWGDHRVAFKRHVKSTGWPDPQPVALTTPLDFSDPDTIVHFQRNDEGLTYFYVSTDKGKNWTGPYNNIPKFKQGIHGRTNYEVTGKRSMTAYMELAEDPGAAATRRFPSYAVETTDGGITWTLGSMISATEVAAGKKFEWDTHPSVARIDANTLIASFRSGNQTDKTWTRTGWFDVTRSTDNGKTWSHLIRLGESPGNNSCPTSTKVVTLPNGAKRVVTLMWLRPPDKQSCEKSKLLARFSDDKGDTWSDPIILRDDVFGWDSGYPIATVRADGKIVVCYWMKTVNQDEPNYIGATIWDASGASSKGAGAAVEPQSGSAPSQPNIIFILADDMGYGDVGCYGQKLIKTPNIDKLAQEGMRFTQAYAGGPVCAPSRSVLMTGLHNGHTPARDNVPHYTTYLQDGDVTLAEVLQQAGYRCGGLGKWSLGDAGTVGRATRQGFHTWLGYLNQDHAHHYYTEYLDDDDGRLELTGNPQSRKHYSHDLLAERALRFIRESKDRPFFLYGAFTLPHFSTAEEDSDRFAVPATEPYSGQDWPAKAKKYAAMIHRLDLDVGRIVALVDELGLKEKTLIIFTSDNGPICGSICVWEGFDSNGPLRGHKEAVYEGGIRVPFIARWPGRVPAGKTSDEIVAFQDMLPTFAELAGAACPQGLDGISVVAALEGGKVKTPHEYLYWDYGHCRGPGRYYQAVRMGNWKGIRYASTNSVTGAGNPIELYDLSLDLGEANNVADRHPDIVRQIEKIMQTAVTPSDRYPIGTRYKGNPTWNKGK